MCVYVYISVCIASQEEDFFFIFSLLLISAFSHCERTLIKCKELLLASFISLRFVLNFRCNINLVNVVSVHIKSEDILHLTPSVVVTELISDSMRFEFFQI